MEKLVKKLIKVFLTVILIVLLFTINAAADIVTDDETKMKYDMIYYTKVSVQGSTYRESENGVFEMITNFNNKLFGNYEVPLSDEQLQAKIKKNTDELINVNISSEAKTRYINCIIKDDEFIQVDKEGEAIYLELFGLPSDFIGEEVVEKDGLKFKVVKDLSTGLKVGVIAEEKGFYRKTFIIPAKTTYEIIDKDNDYSCIAYYSISDSGTVLMPQNKTKSYEATSLTDAIEHCRENASFSDEIRIIVNESFARVVHRYVSCAINITFNCTITDNNENNISSTTVVSSPETSFNVSNDEKNQLITSATQTASKKEQSMVDSTDSIVQQVEELSNDKDNELIHEEYKSRDDNSSSAKQDDKRTVKSVRWVVIGLSAFLLAALLGGGFVCIQKMRRHK